MSMIATLDIDHEKKIKINSYISFAPFVQFLKEKSERTNKVKKSMYEFIIERFESQPELLAPFSDPAILDKHIDLLYLLDAVLEPMVSEESLVAFGFPFEGKLFHYPDEFASRFVSDENGMIPLPANRPVEELFSERMSYIYKTILKRLYNVEVSVPDYQVFSLPDQQSGLTKYYKAYIDNRFIDLKYLGGELPDIDHCISCDEKSNMPHIETLRQLLPLEDFSAEGFNVIRIEDFTKEECLSELKNIILNISKLSVAESYRPLQTIIQTLVGIKLDTVNFFPFLKVNDQYIKAEACYISDEPTAEFVAHNSFFDFSKGIKEYIENPEIILLPSCDKKAIVSYPMLMPLLNSGVGSYLLHPVFHHDKLVGVMEVATAKQNAINFQSLLKLEAVVPLIAQIFNHQIEKFEEKIEKLIKEQFTAIQSSVEWKFNEVAWEYIKDKNRDSKQIGNIIFENVYPLYGAVDIRNSSIERNIAIQKDFIEQLIIIGDAIKEIQSKVELPLLEGLHFKNELLLQSTREQLFSDDEIKLDYYFDEEVVPLFRHLYETNVEAQSILKKYYNATHFLHGHVYHYRKEYEESLKRINSVVNNYLSDEKDKIQQSYPNYFEKYKTDGVEYNIYIGQSIAPNRPFNTVYLKNLHLWQLTSMIELAKLTRQLLPSLEVPLQTTQLILVHNAPIDISFRKDEKRFDTEGAYNLRYEIMKKRIDKSHIKNTNERLTQPDKIAIVYSSAKDDEEYMSYIHFLQNKGALLPEVEHLELEELQGVYGLKALRISINYNVKPV